MKSKELKARLKTDLGLKPKFGRYETRRIFDGEFILPKPKGVEMFVKRAMGILREKGLTPPEDYVPNGADCDNWALWIWSEVTQLWSIKNAVKSAYPAYAFGFARGGSPYGEHAWNIAICEKEILFFNYGEIVEDLNGWKVKEVTFK